MKALHITDEPLSESAPLALQWSRQYCRSPIFGADTCAWYHGAWQYLRLLGVITGITAERSFFNHTLRRLAASGDYRRILIAGAADYGMLVQVLAACRAENVVPEISVIDICYTPLRLNQWYAEKNGLNISLHQSDIFEFEPDFPFDLVCTHSIFSFFPEARYADLTVRFAALLRDQGCLVATQSVRPNYTGELIAYSEAEATGFGERVIRAAENRKLLNGVTPGELGKLGREFAEWKKSYVVRDIKDISAALHRGGFVMETLNEADEGTQVLHKSANPDDRRSWRRYQICAEKKS